MVVLRSPLDVKQSLSSRFFRSHEGMTRRRVHLRPSVSNDGPETGQNKERASKGQPAPTG
jgi:hypothetical protein